MAMRIINIGIMLLLLIGTDACAQSNEEILKDLKDLESSNNFRVGAGFGNKIISTHNNSLNSQQNNTAFIFTPSIAYFHNSGLSLSASAYGLQNNGTFNFSQFAINPAYDYTKGKDVNLSLSYTHYFVSNEYNTIVTPIKNDFYGGITAKNTWLKPGVEIGYASGEYKNITNVDTTLRVGGTPIHYKFFDTSMIKTSSFSLTATLEHSFRFSGLISDDDVLSFVPQFLVNFGSGKEQITRSTSGNYALILNKKRLNKRKLNNKNQGTSKSPFSFESIGLNLNTEYSVGSFSIEPNVYLDYFIPSTSSKKFTQVYSINFYYSF